MEFQGTQGNWEATTNDRANSITISSWDRDRSMGHVAYINVGHGEAKEVEIQANARLIASAPKILELLQEYHNMASRVQMPTERELNELSVKSQLLINKALNK